MDIIKGNFTNTKMKYFLKLYNFLVTHWKKFLLCGVILCIIFLFYRFLQYLPNCKKTEFEFGDWLIRRRGWIAEAIILLILPPLLKQKIHKFCGKKDGDKILWIIAILFSVGVGVIFYQISNFFSCFWEFISRPFLWI